MLPQKEQNIKSSSGKLGRQKMVLLLRQQELPKKAKV
jgi:hypothetical protein